jgi:hypothetical protein
MKSGAEVPIINTEGITDEQKSTDKFKSAYADMLAQLLAPGFIPVLCAHEAAHVLYFGIAGTINFDPQPAKLYYDPKIDDYAGHLAAVQILDIPQFVQGQFWEQFDKIAKAHAAGGVLARRLMPSSDGGDQNDRDRFKAMCEKLSADPNFKIDFDDYWKRAQEAVSQDLENTEWLAKIQDYAVELRPQLGL